MKVLFVQEQPQLLTALKMTFANKGYDMVVCNGVLNPHSVIEAVHPDIVIADITKASGITYVEEAKCKNIPVMVLSSSGDLNNLQDAFDKGADDYISFPLSYSELVLRVGILTKGRRVKNAA